MKRLFPMPYTLWVVLALPLIPMMIEYSMASESPREALRALISPSGQWGAWLILVALMATPLSMLLRGWAGPRWLVKNRRSFGVAGFCYASLHTVIYLGWRGRSAIYDAFSISHGSGWVLLLVLVPVAVTSSDVMMRWLGPRWKSVQRVAYVAAAFTLLHWVTLHGGALIPIATASFLPLVALTIYRWRRNSGYRRARG